MGDDKEVLSQKLRKCEEERDILERDYEDCRAMLEQEQYMRMHLEEQVPAFLHWAGVHSMNRFSN